MERMICLDGVPVRLDVDRVEVDLNRPGLKPADHPCAGHDEAGAIAACCNGEVWQPLMTYHDGTTIYLHCPAEGEEGPLGYKIDGPRPHRWNISFLETGRNQAQEKVAHLSWEAI